MTHVLTALTTQLNCICVTQIASLSDADVASMTQCIVDDQKIINTVQYGAGYTTLQVGSLLSAATSTTSLSTLTSVALGSGPALTANIIGSFVSGPGITPGTTVTSITGSGSNFTLGISAAPQIGQVNVPMILSQSPPTNWYFKNGLLVIPNRGTLQLLPGDVLAVDRNTGWPFVLSSNSINAPGSPWVVT